MGAHKKVHIRKLAQMTSVRERWRAKKGRYPDESDVERMFESFVPMQLKCLDKYTESGETDETGRRGRLKHSGLAATAHDASHCPVALSLCSTG